MAFWWVNHKQTSKLERDRGYIWSPETNKDGSRNDTYLNLTRVKPTDIVFSYAQGNIGAVGIVEKKFVSAEKPDAKAYSSNEWSGSGWKVQILWVPIYKPFVPKNYIESIRPLLPDKHSPLKSNGGANINYLTSLSEALGNLLMTIIEEENMGIYSQLLDIKKVIEGEYVNDIIGPEPTTETQREQIIQARVGQGIFRTRVEDIEKGCRWTGTNLKTFLTASHIKPWKYSTNLERLDGHNGLLLSPHVDKLFDRGYISFQEDGNILISSGDLFSLLRFWNLDPAKKVGRFSEKQQEYLQYHREKIFNQKY